MKKNLFINEDYLYLDCLWYVVGIYVIFINVSVDSRSVLEWFQFFLVFVVFQCFYFFQIIYVVVISKLFLVNFIYFCFNIILRGSFDS